MLVIEEQHPDEPRVVLSRGEFLGQPSLTLVGLPRRAYTSGVPAPPLLAHSMNARRARERNGAASSALSHTGPWLAATSKAQQTLLAWFLLAEDPQRRLEVSPVLPLKHQRTLVEHVLATPNLDRVLIGDEVGLGKTIEAGLIVQRLRETSPGIRILYLAPARLVSNVVREWRHLGLDARRFTSANADARPTSDLIVAASLQKAVRDGNREALLEAPWDVVIADECHHLSDYGAGSTTQAFRLVRDLSAKQPSGGRLILMSGTPHQGNPARFRNLLGLLRREGEDQAALAGRVIFRIKERVTDWDGNPLFPLREVRPATAVSLGDAWGAFYEDVSDLYDVVPAGSRAGGWAKSQALQWVASSVEAGVAYLARLAMRRLGWTLRNAPLAEAIASLVPYGRGGRVYGSSDGVFNLFRDMGAARAQAAEDEDEDVEEPDDAWRPDAARMADLLRRGAALVRERADDAKWEAMRALLREAGGEKVVLFCQPVETVAVVADAIARSFGQQPSIIVGGQDDAERERQVERFLARDGAQFLVSSRAGGEGINLQVARRLVHLDVPWNPMDMEQRIGRVHRFGSRQRILVDTLVVRGTREERAYQLARDKLHTITRALSLSESDAEQLFGRVMSLVPPEELQDAINGVPPADPPSSGDTHIGALVSEGYRRWEEFTREYSESAKSMAEATGGCATWADLGDFLGRAAGAEPGASAAGTRFRFRDGDSVVEEVPVATVRAFGKVWVCDSVDGLPARDEAGAVLPSVGLNTPEVARTVLERLRAGPVAGAVRLPPGDAAPARLVAATGREGCAVLVFACQHLLRERDEVREDRLQLAVVLVGPDGEAREAGKEGAAIVRTLVGANRVERPPVPCADLATRETDAWRSLTSASVAEDGARFAAVWPVACFLVAPPG